MKRLMKAMPDGIFNRLTPEASVLDVNYRGESESTKENKKYIRIFWARKGTLEAIDSIKRLTVSRRFRQGSMGMDSNIDENRKLTN